MAASVTRRTGPPCPCYEAAVCEARLQSGSITARGHRFEGASDRQPKNGRHVAAEDAMMETENESLRERVALLEKKALAQGDELVCLRATLADALRRLAALEARPSATPLHYARNGRGFANHVSGLQQHETPRLRQPTSYQDKESLRRASSFAPSSLPQRRAVHYQSTGSLHSDSPSSSSVSPVPTSPPPVSGTPAVHRHSTPAATPAPQRQTPTSSGGGGGLANAKRWNSTGDFNHAQAAIGPPAGPAHGAMAARLATKSLFNLHLRGQQQHSQNLNLKHGTRDASYNEEEGTVRIFLRGRPVVVHAPAAVVDTYDLSKVSPAPHSRLKLEWVYGYRGRDCRSNLQLLPTGEIVYFVAAVVVLHNVEEQSQRHYLGHTDDVKCMSVHPNKLLIATGQTAGHDRKEGRPHIRVWNSVSLATISIIGTGEFERSICCVSFSKVDGGVFLCAVDEAPDHNISVWDWHRSERGYKITETKCSADTVVAAEFHPLDKNSIVTCGKSHINFWSLDAGGTLYKRMGIFENRDKPKYVTCLAFTQQGDVISGDTNGNVIVWGRGTNTIAKFVRNIHEGSVFSICVLKDGSVVTGGGKDGRLVQLDSNFAATGTSYQIPEYMGGVRTVSEGRGSLLVGTTRSGVLVGDLALGLSPAVLGHTDELWGLATHPSLPQFVTAGYDRLLQLWDSMSHGLVWSKDIGEPAQSAVFSPNGEVLVVGCTSGRWYPLDYETREVLSLHTDGSEPIQVIKFSPNGNLLAVGSRDNNIYVYQVTDEARKYSRIGRCSGHSSYITHLDWSEDSQNLRSNSGDYELLYWNAGLCRQLPHSASLRDVAWASTSCTLTFETIGIWPEGADGTDVNCCDRAHVAPLLASADDFGKVKLYAFPTSQPKSLCHSYGGHSSHVTAVAFLHDDSRIISTGGKDTSVMQWMLV